MTLISRTRSQIRTIALFTDYRIQSNADNQISLLLSTEALLHVLRSAESSSNADDIVMKLAKKRDVAVLSFEILGAGTGAAAGAGASTGGGMKVTHDVRIEVLKPAEVERLREPLCPEPDVRARSCSSVLASCMRAYAHARTDPHPPPATAQAAHTRRPPPPDGRHRCRARQWRWSTPDIGGHGRGQGRPRMGRLHKSTHG